MNEKLSSNLKNLVNDKVDDFKNVDILNYIIEQLENNTILVDEVVKTAKIKARQGTVGEKITTIMFDGFEETNNIVKLDEKTNEPGWIVTGINGEQYIVKDSNFKNKYEIDPENEGQYKPKRIPTLSVKANDNLSFNTLWGEKMRIKAGGFLIVNSPSDIYAVQEKEFFETYESTGKSFEENIKNLKEKLGYEKILEEKKQNLEEI